MFAIADRFHEHPTVRGYEAMHVFTIGIGLMVAGCFNKLWSLSMRESERP